MPPGTALDHFAVPALDYPTAPCADEKGPSLTAAFVLVPTGQSKYEPVKIELRIPQLKVKADAASMGEMACLTTKLKRAQRMELSCYGGDHADEATVLSLQGRLLLFQREYQPMDAEYPFEERWAVELPCGATVRWQGVDYAHPRASSYAATDCDEPCRRVAGPCHRNCRERYADATGEVPFEDKACNDRCAARFEACKSPCYK